MKTLLFLIMLVEILSCKSEDTKNREHVDSLIAQTNEATSELRAKREGDSILRFEKRKILFDTFGLNESPIKVLAAKLVAKEYSNAKDIFLKWENVSKKKVDGIKFRWYGIDVFGEPADMGISIEAGFGGGFTDAALSPGRISSATWEIFSRSGKKIVLAWPYEVVFSDGSTWKSSKR